jgi:hypothetical protein
MFAPEVTEDHPLRLVCHDLALVKPFPQQADGDLAYWQQGRTGSRVT